MAVTSSHTLTATAAALLLLLPAARAQTVLHTFDSPAQDEFGASVSGAGDVNGDGHDDLIVGAPQFVQNGSGYATVHSGLDGSTLYTLTGPFAGAAFGHSVSGAGDTNGDGFDDMVVGAYRAGAGGYTYLISGADGSTIFTFVSTSANAGFGFSVRGAGDVDADGRDDVIIGAPFDDVNGGSSGSARVFSGLSGLLLHTFHGDASQDSLGWAVGGAGDVNQDGHADLIVGAPYNFQSPSTSTGYARVYSGLDGSILYTFHGDSADDEFGSSVGGGRDVDGDGTPDLIVGAPKDDDVVTNAGSARVFSGATGAILFTLHGDGVTDEFGGAVDVAGDVDGDGRADLVVGSRSNDTGGTLAGFLRVFSGEGGGPLYTVHGDAYDLLGKSVSAAGDVDGDGLADVIGGASSVVPGTYARVFAGRRVLGASYCGPAAPNSTGRPGVLRFTGLADPASNEAFLTAYQLPRLQPGLFLAGRTQGALVPPGSQGTLCLGGDVARFNGSTSTIQGPTGTLRIDLSAIPVNPSAAVLPGETWNFQCWYRDVPSTSNFTQAVSVLFP